MNAAGRVLLTGATGFVGRALAARLRTAGRTVVELAHQPRAGALTWRPEQGECPEAALDNLDAVVHLAGENVAQRWSAVAKKRIRDSRVLSTRLLAERIAALPPAKRPRVFLCASAIGFYGVNSAGVADEDSPSGTGFLAELTRAWEAAAQPAVDAGVRVVIARIGVVLGRDGGAVKAMRPAFLAGLGGPVGPGTQRMSWIALDDLTSLLCWLLERDDLRGPFNAVGPAPCTNREMAHALGQAWNRPAAMPAPAFALKLMFGEMAEMLLGDLAVTPKRARAAGFVWRWPELAAALRHELADPAEAPA